MTDIQQKLIDIASDPEQYTQGEAVSWMADDARQKAQEERFGEAIKSYIPSPCVSVLDIGCGSGWAAGLAFKLGVKNYVGLEPSLKNFEVSKHKHPELNLLHISLEDYKTEQTFDCVLAVMVLSHIKDIETSLKKVFDLLNVGGVFIFIVSIY